MNTVLWIFISVAFGLLLFTSLQDKIPDELSFLRSTSVESLGEPNAGDVRKSFTHQGWRVRQEGPTIEFTKSFSGGLEVHGTSYDVPEIGILCHQGKLDVRVDTRIATTGISSTPVIVNPGGRQEWNKGAAMNIFPPNGSQLVVGLAKAMRPLEMTVSYLELGNQKTSLDPTGLLALVQQLPQGCKVL